jgi:hypothetical protein
MQALDRVGRRDDAVDHALGECGIDFAHRHVDRIRAEFAQHIDRVVGRAQAQTFEVGQGAHRPGAGEHAGEVAALHRQHVQPGQLAAEFGKARGEAVINRDLVGDRAHAAVEARLRA